MDDILLYHTKTLQQIYLSYRTLPVVLGFPVFTLYLIPAHLQFLTDLFLNRIPSFSSHLISSSSPSPNLHIPNLVCPFQSLPILLSPPPPHPSSSPQLLSARRSFSKKVMVKLPWSGLQELLS